MKDLISRQTAIDALMKRDKELRNFNWYDKPWAECECKGIDYALEIVNALPSVQPTQSNTSNTSNALKTLDCIDRQAAIDAVGNMLRRKFGIGGDLAEITLAGLPPAQPEIIYCKECKYGEQDEDGRWYCRNFGCQVGNDDGSGFCADAERRTDD